MLGFAAKDGAWRLALAGLLPVLLFWGLDAYYLMLERRFRELFNRTVAGTPGTPGAGTYNMVLDAAIQAAHPWRAAVLRPAVLVLHGVALICLILAAVALSQDGGPSVTRVEIIGTVSP